MAVPILLITGFLGAGKTTLINRLLSEPRGRRLAAVVNDFGAIDIDAALLGSISDGVVSLKNGCICCSLQGDLLQTLSMLLRRVPAPDGIIIETSGVSNPAEIVQALLDPVVWREAALDAVVCVTDARNLTDQQELLHDSLWQSQVMAADYIAMSKIDLVSQAERDNVSAKLRGYKGDRVLYEMVDGQFPPELLFSADLHRRAVADIARSTATLPDFQTVSWTSQCPLVLPRFQAVVAQNSTILVRAKGIVVFAECPDEPMVFQLVGHRATIGRAPAQVPKVPAVQLVFIAKSGTLDERALTASLEGCCAR
ncbi:MAG: GTP-binding protein [Hyphomicrobiaceae bacterium]